MTNLSSLTPYPPGQLDILGHDGDPLGVDGAEVGVLEEADQVGLAGLLQGSNSCRLEPIQNDYEHYLIYFCNKQMLLPNVMLLT